MAKRKKEPHGLFYHIQHGRLKFGSRAVRGSIGGQLSSGVRGDIKYRMRFKIEMEPREMIPGFLIKS